MLMFMFWNSVNVVAQLNAAIVFDTPTACTSWAAILAKFQKIASKNGQK